MKNYTTIDKTFQVLIDKLENVTRSSENKITARCPAHDDEHNSLSVSKEKDKILFKCFAGCSFKDIVTALDFKESDMFARNGSGLTVEAYAEAKRLPVAFLRERFGLSTETVYNKPAVRIPYFNEDGETIAVRFRLALAGDNRFVWRKRDKTHPYGLNGLSRARELGYIVLVEGESDTQTLWYHGIPALGIPGANTWRRSWAEYLAGLTVYVWKEPGQGGDTFVRSIARDIPNVLVLTPPENRKDISECHIAGDDVIALLKTLRDNATAFNELLARETAELADESLRKAGDLAECTDILGRFNEVLSRVGLVGEDRNAKILYLALTSRLLDHLVSVVIKGPSSGGKSHLIKTVLRFFPDDAHLDFTNMSNLALVYDERPIKHKFIVLYEAEGIKDKDDEKNTFAYLLRSLLSEGRIDYMYTVKTDKGMKAQHIYREGPTGLITTTTQVSLHPENETRMLSLTVRDDREQTQRIIDALSLAFQTGHVEEVDTSKWQAFQTWLELAGNCKVRIPYAVVLGGLISPEAVRLRRDYKQLCALIQAHALLHRRHREVDGEGYILATIDDYRAVYHLVKPLISEGVEASVKETVRQTVEAVRNFQTPQKKPTTVTDIARMLNIDKAAASRRLREALEKGYLALDDSSRGRSRKYIPGAPLPEEKAILPTPEEVARVFYGDDNPPPVPGGTPPHTPTDTHGGNGHAPEKYELVADGGEHVLTIKHPTSQKGPLLPAPNIVWLETPQDIEEALQDIAKQQAIGLDVETTTKIVGRRGKKEIKEPDKLRLVQLATQDRVYMLDAFKTDVTLLTPLFNNENLVVVGHNIKFDLAMLRKSGVDAPGDVKLMDTFIASQLLSAGLAEAEHDSTKEDEDEGGETNGYHSLLSVTERYLNLKLDKGLQTSDWSGELTQEQIEYAARDAQVLLPLRLAMRVKLKGYDLIQAMTLEMEALPTVLIMEETGVYFKRDEWQPSVDEFLQKRDGIERQLNELAGAQINWRSPAQVVDILKRRGHKVDNANKQTLKQLETKDEVALLLLKYRQVDQLIKAFGSKFLDLVDADGRIHPTFYQCSTATGRMSCRKPNLQQIPNGSNMRACFAAPKGRVLVKADYSQIELRIVAELTCDEQMLSVYNARGDIHTMTAQLVMGREQVSKEDRKAAKAINFGLIYGMQPEGLRNYATMNYGIPMSLEEAKLFHRKFFETYKGIARWHSMTRQEVWENKTVETRTFSGRRRLNVDNVRKALNTPVQGTGADGLKAALGLLWKTRHRFPTAKPVLAVHDEIVVECDESDAEAVQGWLVGCMVQGMKQFLPSVPVEVEPIVAKDWAGKELFVPEITHG